MSDTAMGAPSWGTCENCEEFASVKKYEGEWWCFGCRWNARHPNEPPLY